MGEELASPRRGLGAQTLALYVKGVGQFGKHAAAKNAGFQKEDVIVQLASLSGRMTESEVNGRLLTRHSPGEKLDETVLRGTQRIDLRLPMQ